MPGAWDWRVEHENATGSAKSEIEILVTRNHMDSELSCLVNSSAMKVSLVQKDWIIDLILTTLLIIESHLHS